MASEIGLQVAHFADHDDIGIFAQRAAQGRAERLRVRVHFALGDVATLRLEDVFDRILQRDDVLVALDVHLLDERGQRGRFAAADRAGDEDEPVVKTGEHLEALGQAEFVHRAHLGADDAEDEIDPEPLPNDAGAEAPELGGVGKIDIAAFVELRPLRFVEESGGQRLGVLRGQLRRVRPDRLEGAVEPPDRRRVDAEMNIGGAAFLADAKDIDRRAAAAGRGDGGEVSADMRRNEPRKNRQSRRASVN